MKKFIIIILIFFTSSCHDTAKKIDPISIIIESGQSYKYNLADGIYTIFFINKPNVNIKFHLSENEEKEIATLYYSLGIDHQKNDLDLNDECNNMPKIYTVLHLKKLNYSVKFKIDEDCSNFYLSNYRIAKKIKTFLYLIRKILNQKSEVRNAPKSDIIYM